VIAFFVALAIVVGVVEISVIIQVGQWICFLNTVGLLLLVLYVPLYMWRMAEDKRMGGTAYAREGVRLRHREPSTALILVAGPGGDPGFVTDASGLLLRCRQSVPSCAAS
jgi:UPF0716 family protein affecting phage T7 exclusion